MTREQARDLLTRGGRKTREEEIDRFLKAYEDGIPIMPVSMFCDFLKTWARMAGEPHPVAPEKREGENKGRAALGEAAQVTFRDIQKSNLLWRLIYGGETLRTKPCPVHRGRWSGCMLPPETACKGACMSGINVTGWLPEPGDGEGTEGPLYIMRGLT